MTIKAILVGTLSEGFHIEQIVLNAAQANELVTAHLTDGRLAQAFDVLPDETESHALTEDSSFVSLSSGFSGGMRLYGPFPDAECAEDFAENERSSEEEWQLMTVQSQFAATTEQALISYNAKLIPVGLNIFDDDGLVVDAATSDLTVQQISDIVDHASQAVLLRRSGHSIDDVLNELEEALISADVIGMYQSQPDSPRD